MIEWKKLAVRGVIVAAGAMVFACSSTVTTGSDGGANSNDASSGTDTGAGSDGGVCTMSISFGESACDTCAQSHCCEQINACFATSDCDALDTCIANCEGDGGNVDAGDCVQQCAEAHPGSVQLELGWVQCLETGCATQCGF